MDYPYVEIEGTAVKGKCRENLWTCEDDLDTVYKGQINQESLKDVLTPILKDYPEIKVKVTNITPNNEDYLHIFKVRDTRENEGEVRAFVRTHREVPNPFRNRKRYAMVNPESTVSFRSLDL